MFLTNKQTSGQDPKIIPIFLLIYTFYAPGLTTIVLRKLKFMIGNIFF